MDDLIAAAAIDERDAGPYPSPAWYGHGYPSPDPSAGCSVRRHGARLLRDLSADKPASLASQPLLPGTGHCRLQRLHRASQLPRRSGYRYLARRTMPGSSRRPTVCCVPVTMCWHGCRRHGLATNAVYAPHEPVAAGAMAACASCAHATARSGSPSSARWSITKAARTVASVAELIDPADDRAAPDRPHRRSVRRSQR